MAITSGFFDSVDGDRTYDADQMTTYFEGLISDGIYENVGEAFIVRASGNGLNITVGSGRALSRTHWIKNDAPITITLSPANVQYGRRDSIFIRYDSSARTVDVVVVEGTPSATAPAPQPTNSETVYDLFLASVYVGANATVLTQSAIHDNRGSSACPWITGIIKQVDTSQLFLQYQAAYLEQFRAFDQYLAQKQIEFETWFGNLTANLTVDTTLHHYQNTYAITAAQENAKLYPLGISDYVPNEDILFVIVDGIVLTEGIDFIVLKFDEHFPDINGDGKVTQIDASMILTAYTNISDGQPSGLTAEQEKACDANFNGKIDANDASTVLTFIGDAAEGTYANNFIGWTQFFEDRTGIIVDSDYYIVGLKSAYRSGSQMTIRIIKSVIGEGYIATRTTGDAIPHLLNPALIGFLGNATVVPE